MEAALPSQRMMYALFWFSAFVVGYTYLGYALLVGGWARLAGRRTAPLAGEFTPDVTLVIPAYNEADILVEKLTNSLAQNYPAGKLKIMVITDGSNDDSAEVMAGFPGVQHLHTAARAGKSAAENRAIQHVSTPLVIFTDCNTTLNPSAVAELVRHYHDPLVGAVSGEKRVRRDGSATGAGEGLYWRYESFLKQCDSDIYSLMGAAGELVSFRTVLFAHLEPDTILDDFMQSMRIVAAGQRVVYEPRAYALEAPSASLADEMERKIRISAGGWQAMSRLRGLLLPTWNIVGWLLYVSHRVLRWSLTPLLLTALLPLAAALAVRDGGIYWLALGLQLGFYLAAGLGWALAGSGRRAGPLLIPLYFSMMNMAVFAGFGRFVRRAQPAAWAKARRAALQPTHPEQAPAA